VDKAISVQLFFCLERPEGEVLRVLSQFIGIAVECIDIPISGAIGFAQFTHYSEGFEQGVLVSWPSGVFLELNEVSLVEGLAKNLKTTVLLESVAKPDRWLLAKEDGYATDVRVRYLDDGIDLESNPCSGT
jgi:hypothetical protein